jgi:SAM-dependent methyltransferase
MAGQVSLRQRVKGTLRVMLLPLLRRLQLPFDVMLPRIEAVEREVASLRAAASKLQGTTDNLSRTWLRTENEVARLADILVTEPMLQERLVTLEQRLQIGSGEQKRIDEILRLFLDRVELDRREALSPPGSGAGALDDEHRKLREPQILEPEKIAAARASGRLILNIGCEQFIDPHCVNVGTRELPGVDMIADAGALPFGEATVDEISSRHFVQHFPQQDFKHRLLPHWRSVLKPGGRFRVVTPDGEAMLAAITQGSYSFQEFRDILFGRQNCGGDFHYNLFTPQSLRQLMEEAGFEQVEIPVRGRRNGRCFEFELVARRPMLAEATS